MKHTLEIMIIILATSIIAVAFFVIIILSVEVKEEYDSYENECTMQRYTVRGLPEMLVVCDDGGWFDTSSYNPDREEMIEQLTEEL